MTVMHGKKIREHFVKKIFEVTNSEGLSMNNIVFQSYYFVNNITAKEKVPKRNYLNSTTRILFTGHVKITDSTFSLSARDASLLVHVQHIRKLYMFFSGSTKRHQSLLEELETVGNSLQLRNLSKTRWAARAESLQSLTKTLSMC